MNVRFGIIGPGDIANRFAEVLNSVDGVELTAVASSNEQRAAEFAQRHGAPKVYEGYLKLVEDDMVDVVYIGLTHNFHFDAVKLCLEHGKAVLCEKPLVTNQRDAETLAALSRSKKVLLMEAMWTRCLPTFIEAKRWLMEGRIGKVKLVDASFCFNVPFDPEHRLYNPDLAGGSLFDAGVYPIEFTMGILGETPTMVKGVATKAPTGVDDYVAMSMAFASDTLASLSCGLTANTNPDAKIYGSEGYIVIYDFIRSNKCELYDNQDNLVETFAVDFEDGFSFEMEHFADLYRKGAIESDLVPLRDNIACAKIFDDLRQDWGM